MEFDLKAFLDAQLFGQLLAGWPHTLKLVSFLTGDAVLVFLESTAFSADVVGLLEHGAKVDFFRFSTPVEKYTLFGADGMPTVAKGFARARFLWKSVPPLIVEVRHVTDDLASAVKVCQEFYDLAREKLGVTPDDLAKKYGAT